MADWMIYLLKVACVQAAQVVFYLVFLRHLTFYRLNRGFLLGSLLIGFCIPLLHLEDQPVYDVSEDLVHAIGTTLIAEPVKAIEEVKPPIEVNWPYVMLLLYFVGGCFLLQRYLFNFMKIRKLKYGHELIKKIGTIEVFRTPYAQPFSFFKSVFIPSKVERASEMNLVMAHELQHVQMGHTYDRMFVDFMIVLLWFNPFIYLLRKCLIEVHEYQVDAAVAESPQAKIAYQMSLVSLAGGGFSGPVSFFNFSTIKRRIQMMNRNKSNKVSLLSLALVIPILMGLMLLFSFKMKSGIQPLLTLPSIKPLEVEQYMVGEKPSIFPVSTKEGRVKVTSTFGMRNDPFDGSRKHHHGMDIAAKSGTPVLATAAGIVMEVKIRPKGYGKFIVIKHDDTYSTKYAQLSEQLVKEGDQVAKGEVIAQVGNSGRSTAPHLHYEVIKDGQFVDPVPYILDYKFSQVHQTHSHAIAQEMQAQRELAQLQTMSEKQLLEADVKQAQTDQLLVKGEAERKHAAELLATAEVKLMRAELPQRNVPADPEHAAPMMVEMKQVQVLEERARAVARPKVEVAEPEETEVPVEIEELVEVEIEELVEVEIEELVEVEVVIERAVVADKERTGLTGEIKKDKDKKKSKNKNKSKDKNKHKE